MSFFVFVSFSDVNGISFPSAFSFTAENEKNAFRSASSIHHKKVLVLVSRCKVLVLNARLGLGLGLEQILHYITDFECCTELNGLNICTIPGTLA